MSYIYLPAVLKELIEPLAHCLRDNDPYVRKTAAICVAKVYVQDPHLVDKEGLYDNLRSLLSDPNPTVVANAVAALLEISERSKDRDLDLDFNTAGKLVAALGDCSECVASSLLSSSANSRATL